MVIAIAPRVYYALDKDRVQLLGGGETNHYSSQLRGVYYTTSLSLNHFLDPAMHIFKEDMGCP